MNQERMDRQRVLFPLLVAAAIGVVVLSGVGTAAILGWLPSAASSAEADGSGSRNPPTSDAGARGSTSNATNPRPADAVRVPPPSRLARAACVGCATVQSVSPIAAAGESSGLGAVAGGVVGGVLGSQIGGGNGRKLATIAGAGGGAVLGDRIERDMNAGTRYRVVVRADDGSTRSFVESSARWEPGDRVRIDGERLVGPGVSG